MSETDAASSTTLQGSSASAEVKAEEELAEIFREQAELFRRFDAIADKPVRVRRWDIEGLERTRLSVLEKELEVLGEVQTFGDLRDALQDLYISLENLNIFSIVNITAGEPPEEISAPEMCDVSLKLAERKRLGLKVGSFVQGAQGGVEAKVSLVNTLGLAETVQLDFELGKVPGNLLDVFTAEQLVTETALRISRPRPGARPIHTVLTLHQLRRDNERWSSYQEAMRGGIASVSSEDGSHTVSYELGWRQLVDPSRGASPAVRRHLGHSLKSAVSYLWRHSTFDDPFFPTRGYGIRTLSEFSGLWADPKALRFGRQEAMVQFVSGLSEGVALSLSGSAGLLLPWGSGFWGKNTPISERFALGGVSTNLRGFSVKGIGPTDPRRISSGTSEQNGSEDGERNQRSFDYLGGDLYCSLLAELRFQLPGIPPLYNAGVYGTFFCNGGNNVLLSGQRKHPKEILRAFKSGMRWSVGAGLVWPASFGSIEASYVHVLKSQQRDVWRHGFHLGVSASLF